MSTRRDPLGSAEWEWIEHLIHLRSGSRCEVQSPDCLGGRGGDLSALPRWRRSLHHRRPRGMGGSRRADVHSTAVLVDVCGDGVAGCHGYVEANREWAFGRGLLLPKVGVDDVTNAATVPLVLPSGRRVLLDPDGPFYLPVTDGLPYAI